MAYDAEASCEQRLKTKTYCTQKRFSYSLAIFLFKTQQWTGIIIQYSLEKAVVITNILTRCLNECVRLVSFSKSALTINLIEFEVICF